MLYQNRGCALECRGAIPLASDDMSLPPKPSNIWPERLAPRGDAGETTTKKINFKLLNETIEEQFHASKVQVLATIVELEAC